MSLFISVFGNNLSTKCNILNLVSLFKSDEIRDVMNRMQWMMVSFARGEEEEHFVFTFTERINHMSLLWVRRPVRYRAKLLSFQTL